MTKDRYGLTLSTMSPEARDAYLLGADALLGAQAGVQQHLQRAIEADPNFALAWIALARGRFLQADVAGAREATGKARALAPAASAREQAHVDAIALAMEGKPVEALAATRAHLSEYPRDALALAPATGVFGLIGFSGRQQREHELHDWLHALAPHYGDDWWFNCVYAFAECESGRLAQAHQRIERSMTANPGNAHGAHIFAHVLHEQGQPAATLEYLQRWIAGYDRSGLMHCHLSWHLALSALLLGRTDLAWQVYRSAVHPGGSWGPPLNTVTDAASFLWRAELAGEPSPGDLWRQVHEFALKCFPKVGVAFADVHVAIACVSVHDQVTLQRMASELNARLAAGRLPAGEVVPLLLQAFAAFAAADWSAAITGLERSLPGVVRIGGSRAQRDLVEHSLLAAYLKAGRAEQAQRLIAQRLDRRPAVELAEFARH
jgi:tetratricopeptide (TPR) repeat protein